MKLLIITQKVDINDDNLGFFHRWLEKLASRVEKLYVICLAEGEHHLPRNTTVYSLGKERGYSKISQLFRLQKFLFKNLPETDGVFVHMCPIYAVASWPLVKIFKKRMILWFLHRNVNWKLKLAEKCVDRILTASEESCRLKNRKKIEVVGHGIDIDFFKPLPGAKYQISDNFRIISVSRISPIKNLPTLIKTVSILVNKKNIKDIEIKIIGTPLGKDEEEYKKELKEDVDKLYKLTPTGEKPPGRINFLGGKPHRKMAEIYQQNDLLINLSPTGGMDKVVLEAMACAIPVLVSNRTFKEDFGNYADALIFQERDPQDLAQKILDLRNADIVAIGDYLRKQVVRRHNLDNLIVKIIAEFHVSR